MKTFSKGLLLLAGIGFCKTAGAQQMKPAEEHVSKVHIGLGFGMDYGGMGIRAEYLPVKYVGIFGGLGYNFQGLGVNGGLAFRPLPDCKLQPIALVMYGYNAAIKIDGSESSLSYLGLGGISKSYYGLSTGIGGELKVGRHDNRLFAAVWYPFRSQEFHDNYDRMKASPYVDQKNEILPVGISIGFNWAL